jgi:hypothetical protein
MDGGVRRPRPTTLFQHEFLDELAIAVVDGNFKRHVVGEGVGGAAEELGFCPLSIKPARKRAKRTCLTGSQVVITNPLSSIR